MSKYRGQSGSSSATFVSTAPIRDLEGYMPSGLPSTWSRRRATKSWSWMGSAQMGPPTEKPDPVSGHCWGTTGLRVGFRSVSENEPSKGPFEWSVKDAGTANLGRARAHPRLAVYLMLFSLFVHSPTR